MHIKITAEVDSVVIGQVYRCGGVQAYLYDHTRIKRTWRGEDRFYAIVTTTAQQLVKSDEGIEVPLAAGPEALRLATYQCERLQSGLHFAIVAGTDEEAYSVLDQQGFTDEPSIVDVVF